MLFFFLYTLNWNELRVVGSSLTVSTLIIIISLTILNVLIKAYRWKLLVETSSRCKVSLVFCFNSIIAGVATGSLIPARVEFAKPLMVKSRYDVSVAKSFAGLVIERFFDFMVLILFLILSGIFVAQDFFPKWVGSLALIIFLLVILILIFFPQQLTRFAAFLIAQFPISGERKEALQQSAGNILYTFPILRSGTLLLLISSLSLLANSLEVYRLYYLFSSLHVAVPLLIVAFSFSAATLVGVFSLIPGGIGITEFSASAFITSMSSLPAEIIKLGILVDRAVSYYLLVAIGAIILMLMSFQKVSPSKMSVETVPENEMTKTVR